MKNMKKLVALFAATVMTMSFGVSAFAAEVDTVVDGEGDKTSEFNLVFDVPENATDADIDQMTMIAYLVDDDTTLATWEEYDGSQTIVAMDQVDGEAGFTSVPVDVDKLDDGYAIAVAIGGTDVAAANVYKALVTYDAEEETIIVYGDVDGNGIINASDASWVLTKFGNSATVFPCGNDEAADVDGNGIINASDASWVLTKFGNSSTVFPAEAK